MNKYQFRTACFRDQQPDILPEDIDEFDDGAFHWYLMDTAYFRLITAEDKPFARLTGLKLANSVEISRLCAVKGYDLRVVLDAIADNCEKSYIICAIMRPWLIQALAVRGVYFDNHLPPVELYGTRVPVWGYSVDVIRRYRNHRGGHKNI
jgi:hypothetical protein